MYTKKQIILLILSLSIILVAVILYSIQVSVVSIAAVAAKYYDANELTTQYITEINKVFNISILVELSIYSIFQLCSFVAYILRKDKLQKIIIVINLVVALGFVLPFSKSDFIISSLILFVPILNSILYLMANKTEKSSFN